MAGFLQKFAFKAITNPVTNPDYDARFGQIAYKKGACILRMIEKFMTEEKYRSISFPT